MNHDGIVELVPKLSQDSTRKGTGVVQASSVTIEG